MADLPSPSSPAPARAGRRRAREAAGLLLALLVLALALVTWPVVQRAWIRHALVRAGASDVDLAGLGLTPSGLTAQRIRFTRGPLAVAVEQPIVRLAPTRLLFHRTLDLAQLSAAGIDVTWDLAAAPPEGTAGPAAAAAPPGPGDFAGLLRAWQPPLPIAVRSVDLFGQFTLRRGAEVLGRWRWSLRGGGVAAGQTGAFAWQATAEQGHRAALGWSSQGVVRLGASGRGLGHAELAGGAQPEAGPWPAVTFSASVAARPDGETYQAEAAAGPEAVLRGTGDFMAATGVLTGHATAAVTPAAVHRLAGARLPDGALTAAADFRTETRTQATEAHVSLQASAEKLAAWQPALGALGAGRIELTGRLTGAGAAWTLAEAQATVSGGAPAASLLSANLLHPFALAPLGSAAGPIARVRLSHLPLALANSALQATGFALAPGEVNGAWELTAPAHGAGQPQLLVLASSEPLVAGPLQAKGPGLPPLPALTLRASSRLEVSAGGAHFLVPDLRIESPSGDNLQLRSDTTWRPGGFASRGAVDASLPTFLGGADRAAPFILTGHWSAELKGRSLRLAALQAAVRSAPKQPALLEVNLSRPMELDLGQPGAGLADANGDLATLHVHGVPLGWLSRWLPGRDLAGSWAEGESRVRYLPGHGFALETTQPWRFTGLRFAEGGHEFFRGELAVSPHVTYGTKERWVRFTGFNLRDARGPWLKGRFGFALRGADDALGGGIALAGELPEPESWRGTFGVLAFSLSASAHLDLGVAAELRKLSLTVTHAQGTPLVAISAVEPLRLERTPAAEWLASSAAPLRMVTGRIPLAWLNPLLAGRRTVVDGVLPATELHLLLAPRRLQLAALAPVAVAGFRLQREGELLVDHGLLRFTPALTAQFSHTLLPVFHVRYDVKAGVTFGYVAAAATRLALFDAEVQVGGDEKRTATGRAAGNLWVDLGALGRLPLLAAERLPGRGELRVSVTNDEAKTQAVDFLVNVDRLAGRDGKPAAALELKGHAHLQPGERVGGFAVQARLQSAPHPSDLHFGVRIDNADFSVVDFNSKLEGGYVDIGAVRAFAAAFSPARVPAPGAPGPAPAPAAPAVHPTPPWGPWRGRFNLAIRQLALDGDEIDNLSGQLQVSDRAFILHNLSGNMFDGRWSADFKTDFEPGAAGGDNELTAHFRIASFDAGRVVRQTFPQEIARIDGRLDLDVSLSGRASRFDDLVPQATGTFALSAHHGTLRLTLPKQEMISSGLILGGALTFSPEMKALGRVVSRLQSMPFDELAASGRLEANGVLHLEDFRLESPDLRMVATGQLADAKAGDLMKQALQMRANLYARNDLAVILGGMKLLNKPGTDGYQPLREPFGVAGTVGQPDLHPLYDLLAQGVNGSRGTWAVLMRKVQTEVEKRRTAAPATQVNK